MKVEKNADGLLVEYGRPYLHSSVGSVDGDYFTHVYHTVKGENLRFPWVNNDWYNTWDVLYPGPVLTKDNFIHEMEFMYLRPAASGGFVNLQWWLVEENNGASLLLHQVNLGSFPIPFGITKLPYNHLNITAANTLLASSTQMWRFAITISSFFTPSFDFGQARLLMYAKVGRRQ